MPLTKRQKELLDHIRDFIGDYGYAPSFEEIARAFGYASLATVHEHLTNLERKGYIRKSYNRSRSIELLRDEGGGPSFDIPFLGVVAAGAPIEAVPRPEPMPVPSHLLRKGREHYVLRVEGESMIDEQIRDGDYLVVSSQDTAREGEMVIALIGNESATVKRVYRASQGHLRLQPANAAMKPMIVPSAEVQVQGVVVGVIRKY